MDDPRISASLITALKDADPKVRAEAAYALGDAHILEAQPKLLLAIDDEDASVRQAALDAVGLLGDSRATSRLLRAIEDERPDVRFQAIISLGRVAPEEAKSAVLRLASDSEAQVRHIAIRVAEELLSAEETRAEQLILISEELRCSAKKWLEDSASSVRVAAAILLARAGDASGKQVLVDVVNGRISGLDGDDEAASIELAGRLHLDDAVPGLIRRAFGLRRLFAESYAFLSRVALARMGQLRARKGFLGELDSWDRDRRNQAVLACSKAGLTEAIPRLESMQGNESLADQEAVRDALEALRSELALGTSPQ
jgi:hypothetical protein